MKKRESLKYYLIISGILFLFISIPVSGQEVAIQSVLEKDTILIGDQIQYTIELTQPANLNVQFPAYKDTITGKIEIIQSTLPDTIQMKDGPLKIVQRYLITCFEEGFYTIPGPTVRYDVKGIAKELTGRELYLQVLTMPVDTSKGIYDIKLPYRAPITFKELLPYIVGGVVLVAIILLVFYYVRRRKRKKRGYVPLKPMEPAHVIALRGLNKLKEDKLWQKNKAKLFHSRLTDILRTYLEHSFDIKAMEQTTPETLRSLKDSGFNDNRLYSKLKEILDLADLVKFAKFKPLPQENETSMLDAFIFVNETKPVDKPFTEKEKKPENQENENGEVSEQKHKSDDPVKPEEDKI